MTTGFAFEHTQIASSTGSFFSVHYENLKSHNFYSFYYKSIENKNQNESKIWSLIYSSHINYLFGHQSRWLGLTNTKIVGHFERYNFCFEGFFPFSSNSNLRLHSRRRLLFFGDQRSKSSFLNTVITWVSKICYSKVENRSKEQIFSLL
jgi:hypothetical protein